MRKVKINSVRDAIQSEVWQSCESDLLHFLFSRGVKITVFAGGVRDVVLAQEYGLAHIEPRDWDIGISGICRKEFDRIFWDLGGLRNQYGGYKLYFNGSKAWEIWRQEDTVGLRKTGASFCLKNVLRTFVLSCNAIAFDLDTGYTYDYGALHSLRNSEVSIVDDAIMHDYEVFAAKALNLTFRRQFKLSSEVERFVFKHLDQRTLVHEFHKAYPQTNLLSVLP